MLRSETLSVESGGYSMRRFPSSWDVTLTKLGFRRRTVRRKDVTRYRVHRIEPLETRTMLAADIYTVTTLMDVVDPNDGLTSLREALVLAKNDGATTDNDMIRFDASLFADGPATLELADHGSDSIADQLVIDSSVTIEGPGAHLLSISGMDETRVFNVGAGFDVTIAGLTVTSGYSTSSGGGIHSSGNLTLEEVVVRDSRAEHSGGGLRTASGNLSVYASTFMGNEAEYGAGISRTVSGAATTIIDSSSFYENKAFAWTSVHRGLGGGLAIGGPSTHHVQIVNSTISNNEGVKGAGMFLYAGPTYEIINSTVTENAAAPNGIAGSTLVRTGGIELHSTADLTLHNSIVVNNTTTASNTWRNVYGTLNSASSHNVVVSGYGMGGLVDGVNDNLVIGTSVDPGLAPLDYYGGPTQTHALMAGSVAIGAADPALQGSGVDQRGFERLTADIGAFAYVPDPDFVVSSLDDGATASGELTLRGALALANVRAGADTVTFAPNLFADATASILLTHDATGDGEADQLAIDSDVSIVGPGAALLTIDGNSTASSKRRVFHVESDVVASISGLSITGGDAGEDNGGGVYSEGDLTLADVTLSDNYGFVGGAIASNGGSLTIVNSSAHSNSAAAGGAIYVYSTDSFTIQGSTVANNAAGLVGGIIIASTSNSEFLNTTISGNQATNGLGGGVYFYSANPATATLTNVTITLNDGGPADGGGIYVNSGVDVVLRNSIVAANVGNGANNDLYGVVSGSSSHNLIGSIANSGGLVDNRPISSGYDPLEPINYVGLSAGELGLAPLDYYGGPTKTHAIKEGSLAIGSADPALQLGGLDQRGFGRMTADLGAFAYQYGTALVVNSTADGAADSGALTLRGALALANVRHGADTITFAPDLFASEPTSILLSHDATGDGEVNQLTIDSDVSIVGPGASLLTIDGNSTASRKRRVLQVESDVTATISGLSITGGDAGSDFGGGIYSEGNLTLADVNVHHNSATQGAGIFYTGGSLSLLQSSVIDNLAVGTESAGGGIYAFETESFRSESSLIARNEAEWVGGIVLYETPDANIVNSTISENIATEGSGGGIWLYSSVAYPTTIVNSTIVHNDGGAYDGGGIYVDSYTGNVVDVILHNSIVANNTYVGGASDIFGEVSSVSSHNIIGSSATSGGLFDHRPASPGYNPQVPVNYVGVDASELALAPLTDNGGPTQTHALLPGSLAIDAGSDLRAIEMGLTNDQRGLDHWSRIVGATVDIGAFEATVPVLSGPITQIANQGHLAGSQTQGLTAISADGISTTIWRGAGPQGNGIYGQQFDANGQPLGALFVVSVGIYASMPQIASDAAGNLVVVWQDRDPNNQMRLFARRYESLDGELIAQSIVQLTSTASGTTSDSSASVALAENGSFTIAWQGNSSTPAEGANVYAQRFDAQDQPLFAAPVRVHDDATDTQSTHSSGAVALGPDDTFYVLWNSNTAWVGWQEQALFVRQFNASGIAMNDAQLVFSSDDIITTYAFGEPSQYEFYSEGLYYSKVVVDTDGVVTVAWMTQTGGYDSFIANERQLLVRQSTESGWLDVEKVAESFFLFTYDYQTYTSSLEGTFISGPAAAVDASGRLGISWLKQDLEANEMSSLVQWYDGDWVAISGIVEQPVQAYADAGLHLSANADGTFIVTGQSNYNSSTGYDIFTQRYQLNRAPELSDEHLVTTLPYDITPQANMGIAVSELTVGVTDPDPGAVAGIAIVAADHSRGEMQYSLDNGATWQNIGSVSLSEALLLGASARVRLNPSGPFFGTLEEAITFHAWDHTAGISGQRVDLDTLGDGTALSTQSDHYTVVMTPIVGGEQIANQGHLAGTQDRGSTAISNNGISTTVWHGNGPQGKGIYGQRFDADGNPLGSLFAVAVSNYATLPQIASDAKGNLIVVWQDRDTNSQTRLFGRRYESLGGELIANNTFQITTGVNGTTSDTNASVALADDGSFTAVWSGYSATIGEMGNVYVQRFNAQDEAIFAAPVQVHDTAAGSQFATWGGSVALAADGGFHVLWGDSSDYSNKRLYVREYDVSGVAQQNAQLVYSTADFDTTYPYGDPAGYDYYNEFATIGPSHLAVDASGQVTVAWSAGLWLTFSDDTVHSSGAEYQLFKRQSTESGWRDAVKIAEASYIYSYDYQTETGTHHGVVISRPVIAVDGYGRVGLVWSESDYATEETSLLAQWFTPTGETFGTIVEHDIGIYGWRNLQLNANDDGTFVVTAQSYAPSSYYDITTQRYQLNRAPELSDEYLVTTLPYDITPQANTGVAVSTLTVGVTDADPGAVAGIAIVAADHSRGEMQYSLDKGATWQSIGTVSHSESLLLGASARVRLNPDGPFFGTLEEAITFHAWDHTAGISGQRVDLDMLGDGTAISSQTDYLSIVESDVLPNAPVVYGLQVAQVPHAEPNASLLPIITGLTYNTQAGIVIEFDYNGDQIADGHTVLTSNNGAFSIDLRDYFLPYGEIEVAVRAITYDHQTLQRNVGAWETISFENDAPTAPPVQDRQIPSETVTSRAHSWIGSLEPGIAEPAIDETFAFIGQGLPPAIIGAFNRSSFTNRYAPHSGVQSHHIVDDDSATTVYHDGSWYEVSDTSIWTIDVTTNGDEWTYSESFTYSYSASAEGTDYGGGEWSVLHSGTYTYVFTASGNAGGSEYELTEARSDTASFEWADDYNYSNWYGTGHISHAYSDVLTQEYTVTASGEQTVGAGPAQDTETWLYTSTGTSEYENSFIDIAPVDGGTVTSSILTAGTEVWEYDSTNVRLTEAGVTSFVDTFSYTSDLDEFQTDTKTSVIAKVDSYGGITTTRMINSAETLAGLKQVDLTLQGVHSVDSMGVATTNSSYQNATQISDVLTLDSIVSVDVADSSVTGRSIATKVITSTDASRHRNYVEVHEGTINNDVVVEADTDTLNSTDAAWTTSTIRFASGTDASEQGVVRKFDSYGLNTETGSSHYSFEATLNAINIGGTVTSTGSSHVDQHSNGAGFWTGHDKSSVIGTSTTYAGSGQTTNTYSASGSDSETGTFSYMESGWEARLLDANGITSKSGAHNFFATSIGKGNSSGKSSSQVTTVDSPESYVTVTSTTNATGDWKSNTDYIAIATGHGTFTDLTHMSHEESKLDAWGKQESNSDTDTTVVRVDNSYNGTTTNSTDVGTYSESRKLDYTNSTSRKVDDLNGILTRDESEVYSDKGTTSTSTSSDSSALILFAGNNVTRTTSQTSHTERDGTSNHSTESSRDSHFHTLYGSQDNFSFEFIEDGSYDLSGNSLIDVHAIDTSLPGLVQESHSETTSLWTGTGVHSRRENEESHSASGQQDRYYASSHYESTDDGNNLTTSKSTSTVEGTETIVPGHTRKVDSISVFNETRNGNFVATEEQSQTQRIIGSSTEFTSANRSTFDEAGTIQSTRNATSDVVIDNKSIANYEEHSTNNSVLYDGHDGTYQNWNYSEAYVYADGSSKSHQHGGDYSEGTTQHDHLIATTSSSEDKRNASSFNPEPDEDESPFSGTVVTSNSATSNHDVGSGDYEAYSSATDTTVTPVNYYSESHSASESWRKDSTQGWDDWTSLVEGKTETHTEFSGRKTDSEETSETSRSGNGITSSKSFVRESTHDNVTTSMKTFELAGSGTFDELVSRDGTQDVEEKSSTYNSSSSSSSHGESHYALAASGNYTTASSSYYELFADGTTASADSSIRQEHGGYDDARTTSGYGETEEETNSGYYKTTEYTTGSSDLTSGVTYSATDISKSADNNGQTYSLTSSKYNESGNLSSKSENKVAGMEGDYSSADVYWESDGWSEEKTEGNGTFSNYTFKSIEDPFEGNTTTISERAYHESGDITLAYYKDSNNRYSWDDSESNQGVSRESVHHSDSTSSGSGKYKLDDESTTTNGTVESTRFESRSINGDFSWDSDTTTTYDKQFTDEEGTSFEVNSVSSLIEFGSGDFTDSNDETLTHFADGTTEKIINSSHEENNATSTSTDKVDGTGKETTKNNVIGNTAQHDHSTLVSEWSSKTTSSVTQHRNNTTSSTDYDKLDETATLTWDNSTELTSTGSHTSPGGAITISTGHDKRTSKSEGDGIITTNKYTWTTTVDHSGPSTKHGNSTIGSIGGGKDTWDLLSDVTTSRETTNVTSGVGTMKRSGSDINTDKGSETYNATFTRSHTIDENGAESFSGSGTSNVDKEGVITTSEVRELTESWVASGGDSYRTWEDSGSVTDLLIHSQEVEYGTNKDRSLSIATDGTEQVKITSDKQWENEYKTRTVSDITDVTMVTSYAHDDRIETKTIYDEHSESITSGDNDSVDEGIRTRVVNRDETTTDIYNWTTNIVDIHGTTDESSKFEQKHTKSRLRTDEYEEGVYDIFNDYFDVGLISRIYTSKDTYTETSEWDNEYARDYHEEGAGWTRDRHEEGTESRSSVGKYERTEVQEEGSDIVNITIVGNIIHDYWYGIWSIDPSAEFTSTYTYHRYSWEDYSDSGSNYSSSSKDTYTTDTSTTINKTLVREVAYDTDFDYYYYGYDSPVTYIRYEEKDSYVSEGETTETYNGTYTYDGDSDSYSSIEWDRWGSSTKTTGALSGESDIHVTGESISWAEGENTYDGETYDDPAYTETTTPIDYTTYDHIGGLSPQLGGGEWDAWHNQVFTSVYDMIIWVGDAYGSALAELEFAMYNPGSYFEFILAEASDPTLWFDASFGLIDGFLDTINPVDYWFSIPDIGPIFGHQDVYAAGYVGGVGIGFAASLVVGNYAVASKMFAGSALRSAAQIYTATESISDIGIVINNLSQNKAGPLDILTLAGAGNTLKKLDCFVAGTGVWMAGNEPHLTAPVPHSDVLALREDDDYSRDNAILFVGMFVPAAILVASQRRRRKENHQTITIPSASPPELTGVRMRRTSRDLAIDELFAMDDQSDQPPPFDDSLEDSVVPMPSADLALTNWDKPVRTPIATVVACGSTKVATLLPTKYPSPRKPRATSSAPSRSRWVTAIALLIGLSSCAAWLWGLGGTNSPTFPAVTPVAAHSSLPAASPAAPYQKPIEEVKLGERVLAHNPDPDKAPNFFAEPDQATWRKLQLILLQEGEDLVFIELLRPVSWIEELQLAPEKLVELSLPELGAEGPAVVVAIEDSPEIQRGRGQVVTGAFVHLGQSLVDVVIDGGEPIGCTGTHLFWSEDRRDYVPAAKLQPGETLRTHTGRLVSLTSVTPRAGPEPVYNLEVNLEHVYYVGNDGVLVHNTCPIRMAANARKGRVAESMSGISQRAKISIDVKGFTGTAKFRHPDEVIDGKWLREIKNAKYVRLTNQIRDYGMWVQREGTTFVLQTAKRTKISPKVEEFFRELGIDYEIIKRLGPID